MLSDAAPSEAVTEAVLTAPHVAYLLDAAGTARHVGPKRFATIGYGPYPDSAIVSALLARQREAYYADVPVGAIVVGRDGWQNDLPTAVRLHRGSELRVYSQEMLLTMLLLREDPHSLGEDRLVEMFGSHPALRYLAEHEHFPWPRLRVPELNDAGFADATAEAFVLRESGILDCFGYRVGYAASGQPSRRRALRRAFENAVPARANEELRGRIASQGTPRRLQQVAYSIAHQYSLAARRREADMRRALDHWRADLAWLKEQFYDSLERAPFVWPSVADR
jgi:hypothetical protein